MLLTQAVVLGAVLAAASAWMKAFYGNAEQTLKFALQNQSTDLATIGRQATLALGVLVGYSAPILGLAAIAHIAVRIIEARVPGAGSMGSVPLSRPSAFRMRSILTLDATFATLVSWLVVFAFSTVVWLWFRNHAAVLVGTLGSPFAGSRVLGTATLTFLTISCVLGFAVGGLGLAISHLVWRQRNRMSRAEKQLEDREIHGDPAIAQVRHQLRQQLLDSLGLGLKEATIFIVNPSQKAAALRYDDETATPRLVAVAHPSNLAAMLAEAHQLGIPVFESPALATALCRGAIGESIATAHYAAVAEALSSVMASDAR